MVGILLKSISRAGVGEEWGFHAPAESLGFKTGVVGGWGAEAPRVWALRAVCPMGVSV